MEKANVVKTTLITIIAAIGSGIANILGGWTSDLETLMILMAVDFVMGLLIAAVWKKVRQVRKRSIIQLERMERAM